MSLTLEEKKLVSGAGLDTHLLSKLKDNYDLQYRVNSTGEIFSDCSPSLISEVLPEINEGSDSMRVFASLSDDAFSSGGYNLLFFYENRDGVVYDFLRNIELTSENHGITINDIISFLSSFKTSDVYVLGASSDTLLLGVNHEGINLIKFAERASVLCPDLITQGVELLDVDLEPELHEKAKHLFGEEAYKQNPNIVLLATSIHQNRSLMFWWD